MSAAESSDDEPKTERSASERSVVMKIMREVSRLDTFVMEIAGFPIRVESLFGSTQAYCRAYLADREPEYFVTVTREALWHEQVLLDMEADEEGLKRRKFPEPFLERSVIQRRVAELLADRDVVLMHGSTVAVDGRAYLFTAPCGTGKSTHTRLWREVFGDRAVMVNDDKPFLRVTEAGILAYGSPWSGKHGLGNNVCFPLKGICILSRGPENIIRRAKSREVLDFLGKQCFPPAQAAQVAARVPLWEMVCNKDPDAAVVSHGAMSAE